MSGSSKKQNFLQGAALLALATAIVKVIGALYKLPLNAIIGEKGFGYFYTAYDIYNVLLLISTAGLPVAVSKMISEANALGHYNQVRRVYNTSRIIFLSLGFISSLLMVVFCKQLAVFQEQPDAWFAILCLGPCAFLVCLLSTYRGFFQGQSNMLPTSISQVLEASIKLIVGIAAAIVLLKMSQSVSMAAGGAILGVTVSCLVSAFYLRSRFVKDYRSLPKTGEAVTSYGLTAKKMLGIAIPITIGTAGLQLLTVLEAKVYMAQLLSSGMSQGDADTVKGIYNMCQTIYNMPCSFIFPITISIIPALTAALTRGDNAAVKATEESAARITALIALPCSVGLATLAGPVTALLGGYKGENLVLSTQLMALLGCCIFLHAVVLVTTSLLQAHNHAVTPVVNMLISGVARLIIVYILTGNPNLGLLGVPIGSILSNLCIMVLNILSMRRLIPQKPAFLRNLLRSLLPALLMGAAVLGASWVLRQFTGSTLILCALPVMVGVAVYAVLIAVFKSVTREDCLLLPKGDKIAKLLRL